MHGTLIIHYSNVFSSWHSHLAAGNPKHPSFHLGNCGVGIPTGQLAPPTMLFPMTLYCLSSTKVSLEVLKEAFHLKQDFLKCEIHYCTENMIYIDYFCNESVILKESTLTYTTQWMGYPAYVCSVTQSCPTLCNPMDCSLPGSSVHGILQVRILEWVDISCSRIFLTQGCKPVPPALASGCFITVPPGKPGNPPWNIHTLPSDGALPYPKAFVFFFLIT